MGSILNRQVVIVLCAGAILGFLAFVTLSINDTAPNKNEVVKESDLVAQKELEKTLRKLCDLTALTAETIMRKRQAGVPMQKMMGVTADEPSGSVGEILVIAAYDSPRYHTKEMQERSIEDFRDEAYLRCVKEKLRMGQ